MYIIPDEAQADGYHTSSIMYTEEKMELFIDSFLYQGSNFGRHMVHDDYSLV